MLQPYVTPGAGHPQQAYMITPHPGVQQPALYPVQQPYQQQQANQYLAVSSQHLQAMQTANPGMLGAGGHISGGMRASSQHLCAYGMQQVGLPSVQQKPLYTGSWTNGPITQSPPRPGHSPITSYPGQGMHNLSWKSAPQHAPLSTQNNSLYPTFTSGVTQSYIPTSVEKAATVSHVPSINPYPNQSQSYQSAKTETKNGSQSQSSSLYLSSQSQSSYQSMSQNSSSGPLSYSFLSSQSHDNCQSTQNESKTGSRGSSSYQGQNFFYDIKSAYKKQVSESGSAASSRSSSPQRSRGSSVHSLYSLSNIEAKEDRCASSPPIAPHPFATMKSNVPDEQVIEEEIPKEETPSAESIVDKIFLSRASSHGIQISAQGNFDPSPVKKKNTKKVYREKVKADRFMEIAMKRGIVVTMGKAQKHSEDSNFLSEQNCFGDENSNVNSVSGGSDGKLSGAGTEADNSDNLYSDSCSQSDGEGYLSDFSSHFAKIIIEDVCAELDQELKSGYASDQSSSKLNAEAKEFTMTWSTEEPVALNPESPEFKPSFFRSHEASQSTDEDADLTAALFRQNCNSGVNVYIADQPESIEVEPEAGELLEPETFMVDVAVNTKKIKLKDADIQTPLAFEPRDVCVNTEEMCMREGSEFYTPEILLKTRGTNTTQVETRSRQIQAKIDVTTRSQGVQVGTADSFHNKPCKHCPEKDMQIIKLQMQVCHLRAQMCISELQRQMTELQQSKLQINCFFTPQREDDVQVSNLIDARIEWLHDEITQIKVLLMRCIEDLQKGKPLADLPSFGITIATTVGNTLLVPKELMFVDHRDTGAGESPRSRKRTHNSNLVVGENLSPNKNLSMTAASKRVSTRTLVEESLLELQKERKSKIDSKMTIDDISTSSTHLHTNQTDAKTLEESNLAMNWSRGEEKQTCDFSSGLEVFGVGDPVKSAMESLHDADNVPISSSELSSSRNAKHRKDNQTGRFGCNFDEEFPSLSSSARTEVKSSSGTVSIVSSDSSNSSSQILEQIIPQSNESAGSKPVPIPLDTVQESESDPILSQPGKVDTRESSGHTTSAIDFKRQHSDLPELGSNQSKLCMSFTDHTVNSPLKSLPKPIPTLPFPCPTKSGASDLTNVKTEPDFVKKPFETAGSEVSSSGLIPALTEEKTDAEQHASDSAELEAESKDIQVKHAVTRDPEHLPSSSPRKEAEVRAALGFKQAENHLEDDIKADIKNCDTDTDQLVKKARAVLENFNLTTGKNRVTVTSPKSVKVSTPHSASSLSPASARESKEVNSPTVEVLTTGKSVAGTGEIVHVVDNSVSEHDTGISHIILSARKKLQESQAVCQNEEEGSSTLMPPSNSTSSKSVKSQKQELCVSRPAADRSQELQMTKPPSVQMAIGVSQSDVEQSHCEVSETKQPLSASQPSPQQQQAGQINPNLYQVVFAQVAKAYPHLASNPMMLHSVCLQQTMVLQSYMKGTQGSGQPYAALPEQSPTAFGGPTPAAAPALLPPQPSGGAGSGDGHPVKPTAFQPCKTSPGQYWPSPVPPVASSRASWNPVALVNMMHIRKGVGESQQAGAEDTVNPNPQCAFKFQGAAAPGQLNQPQHAVTTSGKISDTGSVPSVLKDYVLKDKNKNAGDSVASSELMETQQKPSAVKEINPFEPADGVSRSGCTKVTSQKKRPGSKSKSGTGKVSPIKNSQSELFPPVTATKVSMDEDWEDDCDRYPSEFTCKQDVKAPVYFRPIEPARDDPETSSVPSTSSADQWSRSSSSRGRRRNVSERSQSSTLSVTPTDEYQTASVETLQSRKSSLTRSLSNSSADSKPDSRKLSNTGLDDFGGYRSKKEPKPNKPNANFLGRLLKNTVTSNDKKKKEKEERMSNKTPDPEKREETSDDDWQTVSMKKRKRDQTRAEQLPSMAMVPATSKPSSKTSRNNFDKLVDHLEKIFPFLSRMEIKEVIAAVRYQRGGGLTGMKMNDIVDAAKLVIQQKFQSKLMTDDAYKKPAPLLPMPSGGVYCTPEFQKHYEETRSIMPSRPAVKSPGASSNMSNDDDMCPICFEDFSHKKMQKLDCGHEFHVECIRKWVLGHERTCPTCRRLTLFQEEFPRLK